MDVRDKQLAVLNKVWSVKCHWERSAQERSKWAAEERQLARGHREEEDKAQDFGPFSPSTQDDAKAAQHEIEANQAATQEAVWKEIYDYLLDVFGVKTVTGEDGKVDIVPQTAEEIAVVSQRNLAAAVLELREAMKDQSGKAIGAINAMTEVLRLAERTADRLKE